MAREYSQEQIEKVIPLLLEIGRILDGGKCPLKRAGRLWEETFSQLAEANGFVVSEPAGKTLAYDRIVNGLRVQCKQRKTLPSGNVKLCICVRACRGVTKEAYLRDEFDVLALRCEGIVYIIPAAVLDSSDGVTMKNSIRPTDYSCYVNNWDAFRDGGGYRPASQLTFQF